MFRHCDEALGVCFYFQQIYNPENMIKRLTFLLLLCPYWAAATPAEPIHFIEADLATVQQRAAREGKPYFVHFTANWCMPCRWMETHTFTDAALADYVNERYIAVQMDFDARKTAGCKQLYKVTTLPSILIFNSAGELIDRRETSLDATELLKILFDNAAKSGVPIQNQAPADRPVAMTVAYTNGKISRPALVPDEPVVSSAPARVAVAAENQPVVSAPRSAGRYAVQVGVYSDHTNAERNPGRSEICNGVDDDCSGTTDPDGSTRAFEYDNDHHIIAETDQNGAREQTGSGAGDTQPSRREPA